MGFAQCVGALFQAASHKLLPLSQIWNDNDFFDDWSDFKTCGMPFCNCESGRLSTPSQMSISTLDLTQCRPVDIRYYLNLNDLKYWSHPNPSSWISIVDLPPWILVSIPPPCSSSVSSFTCQLTLESSWYRHCCVTAPVMMQNTRNDCSKEAEQTGESHLAGSGEEGEWGRGAPDLAD